MDLCFYTLSDIQKYKNDIVELNRFVEYHYPHTQHKTKQFIFIWLVIQSGQQWSCYTFEERYTGRYDFIFGCIPYRCAEEAWLACHHYKLVLLAGKSGLNWLWHFAKSLLSDPQ